MKYIDLFAGIGGFRKALDSVGMECVYTSEIDATPAEMYKLLHRDEEIDGDITKVNASEIPDHDLLVGGITCQGFSTNGSRTGFNHETGGLFFDVIRVAKEKRPKYIVIENVPGLLNHQKGETIGIMLTELSKIGYGSDFTILSSTDFGLPQQRRRVFIVSVLGEVEAQWGDSDNKQVGRAKDFVDNHFSEVNRINFPFPKPLKHKKELADIIDKDVSPEYLEEGEELSRITPGMYRIKDGTKKGYTEFSPKKHVTTIDYAFWTSKTRRGRVKNGVTKTLDQPAEVAIYDGMGFRKITPLEVFRLQGFSDGDYCVLSEAGFSKRQLIARPSRSVCVPLVKELGKALLEFNTNKS